MGINVNVVPLLLRLIVPGTGTPPATIQPHCFLHSQRSTARSSQIHPNIHRHAIRAHSPGLPSAPSVPMCRSLPGCEIRFETPTGLTFQVGECHLVGWT